MKIEAKVTGLTQIDLVNLFATATEGSQWLSMVARKKDYVGTPLEDPEDCREDKWAKVLLAGGFVWALDYYAEDEDQFYGNLTHKWVEGDEDACSYMRYKITLKDIEDGLARALECTKENASYVREYVLHLMDEDSSFDQTEAEALMQWILFGEEIYG